MSESQSQFCRDTSASTLKTALEGNRKWAQDQIENDPGFFDSLAHQQRPEWLWIGCSDSRVPVSVDTCIVRLFEQGHNVLQKQQSDFELKVRV